MMNVLAILGAVTSIAGVHPAPATKIVSTTWCAATVSGIPGRQKTYYSQLFTTPSSNTKLDDQFKHFIAATYATQPGAVVDAQCQQQSVEKVAAGVRKSDEASDARLSTVVEVVWTH